MTLSLNHSLIAVVFQSLEELGLMEFLGDKSSTLIKVITAVFYIPARHKVEGQL